MKYRTVAPLIFAIAWCLHAASATAGPCGAQIATFQQSLQQLATRDPDSVGTAPQSIGAQLEHQPTLKSVERAKIQARTGIANILSRAERLDAEGRQKECLGAIETARLLLNP